jgi:hypothetical protein
MTYKGTVRGNVIELEKPVSLPQGTRVSIIPDDEESMDTEVETETLGEWLKKARELRKRLPKTSDSVEILRKIREERASR